MDFTGERFVPMLEERQIKYEHLQRYLSVQDLVKGKVVIDAAAGEGYGSYILSQSAEHVFGIDIDTVAINEASKKYVNSNLEFRLASIESLPFTSQSIDVVISFETIEHVDEVLQNKFLNEIQRILKPDGVLVISTPNKAIYSDIREYNNPFHIKEFYTNEFETFLRGFFSVVQLYHQKNEVSSVLTQFHQEETVKQWNLEDQEIHAPGMYLIAVCGNQQIGEISLGSNLHFPNEYQRVMKRILTLQNEVDERNSHLSALNKHIEELSNSVLLYQEQELEYRKNEETSKENEIVLNERVDQLKVNLEKSENSQKIQSLKLTMMYEREEELKNLIKQMENQILEASAQYTEQLQLKNCEIQNKEAHINELLIQERRLHNILDSGGWKLLTRYYKLRDALLPANSKRKLLFKLVLRTLKSPKEMIGTLNKQNIKKLGYYLKVENSSNIESRIDHFLERNKDNAPTELVLISRDSEKDILVFPKCDNPDVSIIIPVYNQWEYTYACLSSILRNTPDLKYEIIIADDMSNDETLEIAQLVRNIHVVRDGTNRGFLLNCNNAAQYAKGKYLFFLNNDTNVQENWLSSITELMDSDETIGLAGSKLIYADGRLQEAGGIMWNDASGWNYGRLDDPEKAEYNYLKEVDYISGAAIMIRRCLWESIGGFDERFAPAYYEDVDLAFEVRNRGFRVVFQPKSIVIHFEGISHGVDTSSGIKSYQVKNKEKLIQKWQENLLKEHFPNGEHPFYARDRSRGVKTIVVVDHYVPHYDKDAGGRCTFMYLKLFREMGFHVVFIGDNYFRHEPYTTELQQLGIEVLYGSWYANHIKDWFELNGQYIDFAYLNRPHISIKYIDWVKKYSKAKIIYFGLDLHYLRELRNYELDPNPELLKSSERWKKLEFELIQKADVIHVVGSYEEEILLKEFPGKNVRNIPLYIFENEYNNNMSFSKRKDLLFVGGFNHKPNSDGLIWFVNEILPLIKIQLPEVKLIVVGSNPTSNILDLQSESVIIKGFVNDDELSRLYSECKVAVVPLRFGAGVKGKVVEAIYNQLPITTTTIGAEGLTAVENLLKISDEPDGFSRSVVDLYQNEALWQSCSAKSKEYIHQYFTKDRANTLIKLDFI